MSNSLEEQCEDAVFKLCCTREHYSVRCANQLEKYLKLKTNKHTAQIQIMPVPNFEKPIITPEQEELFRKYEIQKTTSKSDVKVILNRLKELKNIVKQIEHSKSSEIHQLLK